MKELITLECCGAQGRDTYPQVRGSRELPQKVMTEPSLPGTGKDQTKQRALSAKTEQQAQESTRS